MIALLLAAAVAVQQPELRDAGSVIRLLARRIDGGVPARIGAFMAVVPALTDALYREEVARARAMDPGDKLLEGPRLFDRACRVMADGIRHRDPGLSDHEVLARVEAHLALLQALDKP